MRKRISGWWPLSMFLFLLLLISHPPDPQSDSPSGESLPAWSETSVSLLSLPSQSSLLESLHPFAEPVLTHSLSLAESKETLLDKHFQSTMPGLQQRAFLQTLLAPMSNSSAPELPVTVKNFWQGWTENERTLAHLESFWAENAEPDTELGALQEKYFGFFTHSQDPSIASVKDLETALIKLNPYKKAILTASEEYSIDPLLLVALMYQESKFNQNATSPTGVRGIMQLSRATAKEFGAEDPLDANASIQAGAKYLRYLYDRVGEQGTDNNDQWLLALAAYNQGYGSLLDAQRLARKMGKDDDRWINVRQMYRLMSGSRAEADFKSGKIRGYEAVAHVEKIRYYYHSFYNLAVAHPEKFPFLYLCSTQPVVAQGSKESVLSR